MMNIQIPAQFIRLRKEWKSITIWLLFPLILTLLMMKSIGIWEEETKVPIALVVEEETQLANEFVDEIAKTEMLSIHFMALPEALHKLEQHELDSVFVIREGYEQSVLKNQRNQLIEAYSSNQSFAYQAVVEAITSLAQQDVARSKAAFVIKQLYVEYGKEGDWDYNEIIDKSSSRQQSEALLQTSFSYYDEQEHSTDSDIPIINVWGIWALFMMIATFFMFDWVLKEGRPSMRSRWLFTSISFRRYGMEMLLLYTAIFFFIDGLTAIIFSFHYGEPMTVRTMTSLFTFRLTINIFAFLLASVFRQLFMYYVGGIAISLLLILLGGAIIPLDGLLEKWPWIEMLSPVQSLLTGSFPFGWLIILAIWLALWNWRGGKIIA